MSAIYIETYGCQMNEYDSGVVARICRDAGITTVEAPELADTIVLNTCAVREKAQERIFGRLQALAHLRKKRPNLRIGILGCVAQSLGERLTERDASIDFVVGPDGYRRLPELIERLQCAESAGELSLEERISTQLSRSETYGEIEPEVVRGTVALVTIMRGCDNFCSFCVVPFSRGRERSRSTDSIVREIDNLTRIGVREVTLLGQNVNSWQSDGLDFAALLERIERETEVRRIRFTSPHPKDFPLRLLDLMGRSEVIASHIHLPLQAGATSTLTRMRRGYSRDDYLALVAEIRSRVASVALSTDIIVGFCGESEAEFCETLEVVEEVRFDLAFMFHYSQRERTYAANHLVDDIPEEVKLERLRRLIDLQNRMSLASNFAEIGQERRILAEGPSKRNRDEWMGRSEHNRVVIFAYRDDLAVGGFVRVRIDSATQATLRGELLEIER